MRAKYLFFALIIFSCSSFANERSVKAEEMFKVNRGSILAPISSGWYLIKQAESEIVFSVNPEKNGSKAGISFSNKYSDSDRESLIKRVKKYTQIALEKSKKELISASYQYFKENNISYVKFRITAKDVNTGVIIVEQLRGIMCASPQRGKPGYVAQYEYIGDKVNEKSENEEEAFIMSAKLDSGP